MHHLYGWYMDILCNLSRFYWFIFAERVNDAKRSAALIGQKAKK